VAKGAWSADRWNIAATGSARKNQTLMSIETAAPETAKITPVMKSAVAHEVAWSPEVGTKERRVKSPDEDRRAVVIGIRRRRIVISRWWLLGLRIAVRRGRRGRWRCLLAVSHIGLGDEATAQKDGRQKKTHFHIACDLN
jgi:hypothetical protein